MMKKIGSLFLAVLLVGCTSTKSYNYLVGTYTDSQNQGINVIQFDRSTKALSLHQLVLGVENPSFVIANQSKSIIVAVEEIASENGGKVTSYSYDKKAHSFQKLSSIYTKGNHPCTVAFSPNEDYVLVGNYSGGSLSVFPIDKQGVLADCHQFIAYEGKSVNTERQEKPHVHCIVFHPKEPIIAVADLGTDTIRLIPYDEHFSSFLQENQTQSIKVAPGSGPRHLVWNESGTRLYATFELTNEVGVFEYQNHQLKQIQTIALTAPTKSGSAAELRLSADEQFLYASVRGNDNHIVVMSVKKEGTLEVIQTITTATTPRNFILTKDQKNVLVASQNSSLISVFDRDSTTGKLTANTTELQINKPVYLFPF